MMRNSSFWWILISFMVLLDIYVFQVVKHLSHSAGAKTRMIIFACYWTFSITAIIILILLPYLQFQHQAKLFRTTIFAIIAGIFFAKLIASLFFLVDDIRRVIQWAALKLFSSHHEAETLRQHEGISRSAFLSWTGIAFGGGLFSSLVYGFGNKYRYQVRRVKLSFSNLPPGFKGLKIVQIADIHSGSFTNKKAVTKGVQKILNEKPDLVLFVGDLVNNKADEMEDYMDVFDKIKAPFGVYSTLGNHDYGDYVHWDNPEEKKQILKDLNKFMLNWAGVY